jgi:hypothetical protein
MKGAIVAAFPRLVLEVNGKCDREAMRTVLWRAAGVDAGEVRIEFETAADVDAGAIRLLAAAIRRLGSGRVIRVHGLAPREADALTRYGVPLGVVVGVRPTR